MKRMRVIVLLFGLSLQGCAHYAPIAHSLPVTPADNTARLAKHPEFVKAAQVAPNFVIECFDTITRLEKELADAGK